MTTENLKAVLKESDFIERLEAMENDLLSKSNFEGDAMYYFAQVTNAAKNEISRLADEVIRLRDTPSNNDKFYMDGHSVGLAENENRVKELEAQVTALKKLDDDNNADSVRRLKQMEEDKRTIKELENALHEVKEREVREIERTIVAEAKLKAWEDAPICRIPYRQLINGGLVEPGTYHLKPKEADDEVV